MLTLTVPGVEHWDEENRKLVTVGDVLLELEHSLVSLSKWEALFKKPFLTKESKTNEEVMAYVKCMILTPNYAPDVLTRFSDENMQQLKDYLDGKHHGTSLPEKKQAPSREVISAELIYYWMFSLNIPIECENWNLSRLLTLIKVFDVKNEKPKKMSKAELAARNRELNARRRQEFGTSG